MSIMPRRGRCFSCGHDHGDGTLMLDPSIHAAEVERLKWELAAAREQYAALRAERDALRELHEAEDRRPMPIAFAKPFDLKVLASQDKIKTRIYRKQSGSANVPLYAAPPLEDHQKWEYLLVLAALVQSCGGRIHVDKNSMITAPNLRLTRTDDPDGTMTFTTTDAIEETCGQDAAALDRIDKLGEQDA